MRAREPKNNARYLLVTQNIFLRCYSDSDFFSLNLHPAISQKIEYNTFFIKSAI